ncbi:hypothetical protein ACKAV7_005369 [Fusarium commune]
MRMNHRSVLWLAGMLAAVTPVLGDLDKLVMKPPVPFRDMDSILFKHLSSTPHTMDQWGGGCMVMYRHHDAPLSINDMAENFGRLPVRMRNFVRVQFAVPQKGGGIRGQTDSDLGDIIWYGDVARYLRFWIYEAGHAIDRNIGPSKDDYSKSSAWLDEYEKDGFICDDYAKINHAENFSQEVIVSLFDKVVPNGLGGVSPNWNNIFHQYSTVQAMLGDILTPGGTCQRRFADDTILKEQGDKTQDAAIVAASANPPVVDHF